MILVTGASGFIGSHLVKRLVIEEKLRCRCLVRKDSKRADFLRGMDLELACGDANDHASLNEAMKGIESVIHLAAVIKQQGGQTYQSVNYQGTRNVVEAAKASGVKKIVYLSGLGAGPDKSYPFLYSKWLAEEEVRNSGIPYTILQSSVIFGEGDEFTNKLRDIIKKNYFVPIIGNGQAKIQMIYVEDVVSCLKMALDEKYNGKTIQVGGPEQVIYEEIVDKIIELWELNRMKVHFPYLLLTPITYILQYLPGFPITVDHINMLRKNNTTDFDSVYNNFGFHPRAFEETLSYLAPPHKRKKI